MALLPARTRATAVSQISWAAGPSLGSAQVRPATGRKGVASPVRLSASFAAFLSFVFSLGSFFDSLLPFQTLFMVDLLGLLSQEQPRPTLR